MINKLTRDVARILVVAYQNFVSESVRNKMKTNSADMVSHLETSNNPESVINDPHLSSNLESRDDNPR